MTVRKTVESVEGLARHAAATAFSAARHPIGTAALAVGLVKGTARFGRDLLTGERRPSYADEPALVPDEPSTEDLDVPDPDDLPEPIVIEAEPEPPAAGEPLPEAGEPFHTEPTAATRDSAHGETGGDLEDAAGYADEIPDPEAESDEIAWTSETTPNDDEHVLDEAIAHAVQSEAEMMQRAADPHKE